MRSTKSLMKLSPSTPDFIRKLYNMIQLSPQIISFSEDGVQVLIHNQEKFQQEILPVFFRHSNWRSFVRQMNMYNFRKVNRANQTFIFINQHFRRGNQQHFDLIKRKVNSKEQQCQTEKDYENQLRNIIGNQCQNLSIPNNPLLLHAFHSLNNCNFTQKNQSIGSSITIPSVILSTINHNEALNSNSQLKELKQLTQLKYENQYSNTYINSLTYFLDNIIIYKHQTEDILEQLNFDVEKIVKQRKLSENRNILNSIKDSLQLIDEVKNKFGEKIQNYIQYGDNEESHEKNEKNINKNINNLNNINYCLGSCQQQTQKKSRNNIKNEIQSKHQPIIPQIKNGSLNGSSHHSLYSEIEQQNKVNHINKIKSFNSSSSSINLIITQPTNNNDGGQFIKTNKGKKLIQIKKQADEIDSLMEQHSEINPINMGIDNTKSYLEIVNNNASNGTKYANNNIIKNKVNNGLGLSSLCSFTSVTHLLNFDKQ